MKLKRYWKLILPSIALVAVPLIASSCGTVYTTKLKYLDPTSWGTDGSSVTYSKLSNVNVSIKEAIYGSNYNNGNYIFLFGSTGNQSATDIANFLYGSNGNDGTGNIKVDMKDTLNFSTSPFLTQFYNPGTGEGTGGMGSKNSLLGFSVSLLMFIDYAPYNENASDVNGYSGADGPLDKFTQDEVLAEYEEKENITSVDDLPDEAKAKIGAYKRNDESAIQYRYLLNYMNTIRPGASNVSETSGLIAFKKNKDPQTFAITDASELYTNLLNYYKSS